MRGAHLLTVSLVTFIRIIPADAGSTTNGREGHPALRDHPRGCGEHRSDDLHEVSLAGSSPRMRGAHLEILAIPTIQ